MVVVMENYTRMCYVGGYHVYGCIWSEKFLIAKESQPTATLWLSKSNSPEKMLRAKVNLLCQVIQLWTSETSEEP